jgi:hypothetical protein
MRARLVACSVLGSAVPGVSLLHPAPFSPEARMPSPYDRWKLGLDRPDPPCCTRDEYEAMQYALMHVAHLASGSNLPEDGKAILKTAVDDMADWIKQAQEEGIAKGEKDED